MYKSKEKRNRTFKWSELCPDLLRCVFERLSFTDLNRAKSVCSSWHSASRHCVPNQNQIPWLILFPRSYTKKNNIRCLLFIPDDRDKVYKTRHLGVDVVWNRCLATYGSWLLMMDRGCNLNILNPLTGEKINLPLTSEFSQSPPKYMMPSLACLWIDDRSKDYVVVWNIFNQLFFTKKGNNNTWRRIARTYHEDEQVIWRAQLIYEHMAQKLYFHHNGDAVKIWCLSGDDIQQVSQDFAPITFTFWDFFAHIKDEELYLKEEELYAREYVDHRLNIALTVSGEVLKVANAVLKSKRWLFCISKMNHIKRCWEVIDSLGDEALILDMGITVVAKDIPGIKRNSIYFSGLDYNRDNPDHIFVFDLTTHKIEPLPPFFSSILFYNARWFFPGLSGY